MYQFWVLLTPKMSPSSTLSKSFSSPLDRVVLSPSLPEYLWNTAINVAMDFWRSDVDMLTRKKQEKIDNINIGVSTHKKGRKEADRYDTNK